MKARITQLLLLAAYHNEAKAKVFEMLPKLLMQIEQEPTNGLNFPVAACGFPIFARYLAQTQSPEDVHKFIERTKQLSAK